MSFSGTFIYTITPAPGTFDSSKIPIINTSSSFTTLTSSATTTDGIMTVTVSYAYTTITDNDGLSFSNVYIYYNSYTTVNIPKF